MTVTISPRTLVAFATGLAVALIAVFVFQAWRVDAAPGETDSTFVPITPCRLIDTRPAPNRVGITATFGVDDTKTFNAHGANGECTIPTEAVGLSLNATAVGASAPTFITIWPAGVRPLASSLNPAPGQPPTPNAVVTDLSDTGSFKVYNLAGSVDLVIDVNGYHTNTSLQEIAADLAALQAAQPFAVGNAESTAIGLQTTPTAYVSVSVTAPVAGHVTLNSTAVAFSNLDGTDIHCAIYETANIPTDFIPSDTPSFQSWTASPGIDRGTLSGTRKFKIDAGKTISYSLACDESANGSIFSGNLTAIFTPAP